MKKQPFGIIGGMGPAASLKLCEYILKHTKAASDQQHLPFILYNNPQVPDRTEAICHDGPSPVAELIKTATTLSQAGCEFLVMPCNTAHHYIEEINKQISIPVINMIEETTQYIRTTHPECSQIGILATTGTLQAGVYSKPVCEKNMSLISPEENNQRDLVMKAIYQIKSEKNDRSKAKQLLKKAVSHLITQQAQLVIAGCTEVPLALDQDDIPIPLVNPMEILAKKAVSLWNNS